MSEKGIRTIHWSEGAAGASQQGAAGTERLLTVWPGPLPGDWCFEKAGFTDFMDATTDGDVWDAEFEHLIGRVITYLSQFGSPVIVNEVESFTLVRRGFLGFFEKRKKEDVPLAGQMILAATDDEYGPSIVAFGNPPVVEVETRCGHRLFSIKILQPDVFNRDELLNMLADGREIRRTDLDWASLGL